MYPRSTFQDLVLLLIRLGAGGALIAQHGFRKFSRLLEGGEIHFSNPIGLGPVLSLYLTVFAEFFCAALVIVGLLSRMATIPLIILFLVLIFFVHLHDPFPKIELPLLYLLGFMAILAYGPGRFSIDALRKTP